MKHNKKISALLCGFLLFSALSFGADRNSEIKGRWTSVPPTLRHGNMTVYAFPVTELNFTSYGILFIKQKNGSEEIISLCAYTCKGTKLTLVNEQGKAGSGKGTVSIEERKELKIQGFDEDVLPNGTYWYLGEN